MKVGKKVVMAPRMVIAIMNGSNNSFRRQSWNFMSSLNAFRYDKLPAEESLIVTAF